MKPLFRMLGAACLVAALPFASASAAPTITHEVAVAAGETATWDGTPAVGANVNYNGLIDESTAGVCSDTDPTTKCEYALVTVTNVVPEDDADGKLRKLLRITLDNYTLPSPASDFALTVFETDAEGSTKGPEVGRSDNTDVPDDNEEVGFQVTTTLEESTKYYLVEVVYFTSAMSGYTGTVAF